MDNTKWNKKYASSGRLWPAESSDLLVRFTKSLQPGCALDIAAGEGRNAIWLAKKGWRVHAVDFSEVAVERGSRASGDMGLAIEWEVRDATRLEKKQDAYDLVYIFYLHLPFRELRKVLLRAAESLRINGKLLVVGHDISNIGRGTGGPQDPQVLYTAGSIQSAVPSLKVEVARTVYREVEHEHSGIQAGKHEKAIDCVYLGGRV